MVHEDLLVEDLTSPFSSLSADTFVMCFDSSLACYHKSTRPAPDGLKLVHNSKRHRLPAINGM